MLPYFAGRKQGVGYLDFRSPSHAMKKPARWQRAVAGRPPLPRRKFYRRDGWP
jgi:hypothetical protein